MHNFTFTWKHGIVLSYLVNSQGGCIAHINTRRDGQSVSWCYFDNHANLADSIDEVMREVESRVIVSCNRLLGPCEITFQRKS